jgi:hypothetical protein
MGFFIIKQMAKVYTLSQGHSHKRIYNQQKIPTSITADGDL